MEEGIDLEKLLLLGLAISFLMVSAVACEKEGTAEKAGKSVDRAFDSAKEKLNETTK